MCKSSASWRICITNYEYKFLTCVFLDVCTLSLHTITHSTDLRNSYTWQFPGLSMLLSAKSVVKMAAFSKHTSLKQKNRGQKTPSRQSQHVPLLIRSTLSQGGAVISQKAAHGRRVGWDSRTKIYSSCRLWSTVSPYLYVGGFCHGLEKHKKLGSWILVEH